MLVCGRKDKYQMADEVRDMFEGLEGAPVMVVGYSTHQAMQMIHDYTPKLNIVSLIYMFETLRCLIILTY